MKYKFLILYFFITIFGIKNSYCQYIEFVENKGQWLNSIAFKGDMKMGAIALKKDGGYRMMIHKYEDLIDMHNYYHPHDSNHIKEINSKVARKEIGLHSHVYEVSFLNANQKPDIVSEKYLETYNNYFIGSDSSKWASGCKIFQAVKFKNIYPNIDVRYYTDNGNIKYDFIVHPGGNPNQIIMSFDGNDDLKITRGKLEVVTSVTTETHLSPYTYQPSNEGKKEINCQYKKAGNTIFFSLDDFDKTKELIIDPTLVFSTFSGSTTDNWGFTATYDAAGNFYSGGIVFGPGFPVNNGSTFNGGKNDADVYGDVGVDIGIMKFDPNGTQRLYATYIGGKGNEQPHSLIEDGKGNLIISGRTSSNDYPITFAKDGIGGGRDIILTVINNVGSIVASRVIGGSGDDGMNIKPKGSNTKGTLSLNRNYGDDSRSEVIIDNFGDILLGSCTQSLDFFTTPNAYQKLNGSRNSASPRKQDAVFMKLTPMLASFVTCTYLGGSEDDAAFVLGINPNDKNIYISGGTVSSDFPGSKINTIGTSYKGGDCDGFIAVISGIDYQLVQSTYIGTSGHDIIYGIQFDKVGDLYFTGTTTSNSWPIINAVYNNGGAKQFICKIKPDLSSYIYSTTFGNPFSVHPNISITAFLVDRCQNVYVSGWGGAVNTGQGYLNDGTNNLPTKNRFLIPQPLEPTDGSDFYFFVLERNARDILFGDYFGQRGGITQEHVDGGTSRFDADGVIYQAICANCQGSLSNVVYPTTQGVWSRNNNSSGGCNVGSVKVSFNLAGIGAGVRSSIGGVVGDTIGCVPLTVRFQDTLALGTKYIWDFGDATGKVTTKNADVSHTFQFVGNYKVCVVSVDSSSCNIVDTSCRIIRITADSAKLKLAFKKVGNCLDRVYNFDNSASIAPPTKPFKNNSFLINYGDNTPFEFIGAVNNNQHKYNAPGIYNGWIALVDTGYCNSPDTIYFRIIIIDLVKANFKPPPAKICFAAPINFVNTTTGGEFYTWYFGDGDTSNEVNPSHLYTKSGTYTVKLVAYSPNSCNLRDEKSFTFTLTFSPTPTASYIYSPLPPRINIPLTFTNLSLGANKYLWVYGDGNQYLTNSKTELITHLYKKTQVVKACLIVYNSFDCTDTMCKTFQARVRQLYDIPNAFTPNGDNKNDKIYVRGYGINTIKFEIYNRWGVKVYSSNNINEGWDGKYNGVLQPQEVYHYILNVTFFDDTSETKTGDITLLR